MSQDDLKITWNLMLESILEGKVSMKNSFLQKNPAKKIYEDWDYLEGFPKFLKNKQDLCVLPGK